ncbi:RHS repeat-associated core domain-containing protein [Arcobacter sp. YIC-80]|uniref:RHS repeat-associated core domain-containing protein n=1 Tax=Arcobacter sp. YIC-80 TaxID=3376683 RepID=UPI00385117CC
MKQFKNIFILLCFININLFALVGTTKGSMDINQGSMTYDIKVLLPKGVAGLKPELGINYNSSNSANSILGVGFNLSGQSMISKCNEILFSEKKDASRNYNYCLDGQKLLLVDTNNTYGSYGTEYRTEINSQNKVLKTSNGWSVYSKDGLIKEYKNTSINTDIEAIFKLSSISDRYNNKINYVYSENKENLLKEINYANNKVSFIYEDRIDTKVGFIKGQEFQVNKRLKEIKVFSSSIETSSYKLDYEFFDNKSRITQITECANGICLQPVVFEWEKNIETSFTDFQNWGQNTGKSEQYRYKWGENSSFIDINGDGLLDRFHAYNYKTRKYGYWVQLNTGKGFTDFQNWGQNTGKNEQYRYKWGENSSFIDINGDGLPDRVHAYNYKTRKYGYWVQLNTGKGFTDFQNWGQNTGKNEQYRYKWGENSSFIDINGDGLPDRVHAYNYKTKETGYWVQLNTGKGFTDFQNWGQNTGKNEQYRYKWGENSSFIDINGDGLPDRVHAYNYKTKEPAYWVQLNTGKGFTDFQNWGQNTGKNEQYRYKWGENSSFIDINGDGLPDRVHAYNYKTKEPAYWVQLNTGKGFTDFQNWGQNTGKNEQYRYKWGENSSFIDINGDGLPDRVHAYNYKTKETGYWVQLNTGKGFTDFQNWGQNTGKNEQYRYKWGENSSFIDINGDGLPDRVHAYNYKTKEPAYWVQLNKTKHSKIISITNNIDQEIKVEYSTLRDSEIYTSSNGSAYPNLDIKASAMYVIKSFDVKDASGEYNKTSFKYHGFKINRERGSLGFKSVETINHLTNTKVITDYIQTYPFIGLSNKITTYINNKKISEKFTDSLNHKSYYSNNKIINLELGRTYTKNYSLNGHLLVTKYTKNKNYDKFGNIGEITTITSGNGKTFTKTINNIYDNDESSWILSRLKESSVSHEGTGQKTVLRKSSFEYDLTTGTLITEIIEPNSSQALKKSYIYDDFGNKISETISSPDIKARTTKYAYDVYGKNIIRIENALGHKETREYDEQNQLVKVTGPNGLSTQYFYDELGRKIKEQRADGTTTIWVHLWDNSFGNSLYKVIEKSTGSPAIIVYYDSAARKVRTTKIGFDGANIHEDFYYNKIGKVSKSSLPYFDTQSPIFIYNEYDELGRLVSIDKPSGDSGRIIHKIEYDGLSVIERKPNNQTKVTLSNAQNKKIKVTEGSSSITYKYDAIGNLVSTIDSKGNKITMSYDLYGNKSSMNDPDMGFWQYKYNALGQLTAQIDAKKQTTSMQYDLLGRMIKRTEPEGTTTWKYDVSQNGIGKLSYVVNNSYKKELYYDMYSRISSKKEFIEDNIFQTSYTYTSDGKLEKTISPDGFISINEYNKQGYLIGVKSPKKVPEFESIYQVETLIQEQFDNFKRYSKEAVDFAVEAKEKQIVSNLFFNLSKQAKDSTIKKQFLETSSLSAEAGVILKENSNKAQELASKFFNNAMLLIKKAQRFKDPDFYEFVSYIFRDETILHLSLALENIDKAVTKLNKLSSDNNIQGLDLQKEKEMISAYIEQTKTILLAAQSASESLKNYRVKYEDILNSLNGLDYKTYLSMVEDENYSYFYKVLKADEFGRVTKDIVGNGLVTNREYNKANGHLNYITTGYNDNNDIRDISYSFDNMDNVTEIRDLKQNISSFYEYDNLDRLTNTTISTSNKSISLSYRYDSIGNITYKSDVGSYSYRKAHQVSKAGRYSYSYDLNGNVIKKDSTTIKYSSFNKPIEIKNSNNTTKFYYAPNRSRYKKESNSNITYYSGKLFEKEIINGKERYKNFIYAGNSLVAVDIQEDNGSSFIPTVQYFHKDALGSVDTITNESGKVIQRVSYKPFGNRIIGSWQNEVSENNALTKRGFTGHEHIKEFNLIHMNGRVYDPTLGRFLSADPHIQSPYDTQSYNRYTYVKNNPLKYTDPSGFFFKKIFKKISRAIKRIDLGKSFRYGLMLGSKPVQKFFVKYKWAQLVGSVIAGAFAGPDGSAFWAMYLTDIQGGSYGDIVKSGTIAYASAYVANQIGGRYGHDTSYLNGSAIEATKKSIAHGLSRALFAKIQNQDTTAQFWSGFVASGFATPKSLGFYKGTAITMVVSGTTSQVSGGKFANGAVTGAFIHMYNKYGREIYSYMSSSYKIAYADSGIEYQRNHYGTFEENRAVYGNALLTYYGTISSIAGVSATGRTAWFLWSVGTSTDICSVYNSGDLSQAVGSAAGIPKNGKSGAFIGASSTIYNNFIKE